MLDVADNGPGIPQEDRAHIFDAFYTGRAAKGGSLKGTGIGLSVVLEFVNAHGGSVQIIDGEFPGAHFRITMPIRAIGERPDQQPEGTSACRMSASSRRASWAAQLALVSALHRHALPRCTPTLLRAMTRARPERRPWSIAQLPPLRSSPAISRTCSASC